MRYPSIFLAVLGIWLSVLPLLFFDFVSHTLLFLFASGTVLIVFFLGIVRH